MKKLTYICGLALFLSASAHAEEPVFNSACGSMDITGHDLFFTHSLELNIKERDETTVNNDVVFSENTLIRVQYFKDKNIVDWGGQEFQVIDSRGNSVIAQHVSKHESGTALETVVLDIETGKALITRTATTGDYKNLGISGSLKKISCIESGGGN